MIDVRTPNWRSLSPVQFRARVVELLPEAGTAEQAALVTSHAIDIKVAAAFEFEVGPYDTACQLIDDLSLDENDDNLWF